MSEENKETKGQGAARPQVRAILETRDDVKGEWRQVDSEAAELLDPGFDGDKFGARVAAKFGSQAEYLAARAVNLPQTVEAAPGDGLADDGA